MGTEKEHDNPCMPVQPMLKVGLWLWPQGITTKVIGAVSVYTRIQGTYSTAQYNTVHDSTTRTRNFHEAAFCVRTDCYIDAT